jgi:LytS/YehU family sensor histidine kinase
MLQGRVSSPGSRHGRVPVASPRSRGPPECVHRLSQIGQGIAEWRKWSFATAALAAVLVSCACGVAIVGLHEGRPGMTVGALVVASASAGLGVLAFWLLAVYFPVQLSQARARVLAVEGARQKAELARLRSNLHPHFLLNTLNAVAGLLVAEPRQARQLVIALGDLLRDSLADEGAMRSLGEEVEWLRRYAQIFEIRHAGAIHFDWDTSADTLSTKIPRLLLQPLLENAIEHGALRRPGGSVHLRSRTSGETIQIVVSDDGPGMPTRPNADSPGLGLRLVRDRLQLAYPSGSMTIDSSAAGTSVTLQLPATENAR